MSMEVVAGMLIMWAARKVRTAGRQLNGITDRTLELAAQRLSEVVEAKLGTDPAIRRLVSESEQDGQPTPAARASAETALQSAADRDPRFAAALEAIVSTLPSRTDTDAATGVTSPGIQAGGAVITGPNFGKISAPTKIFNLAVQNPLVTLIAIALLIAAAFFGVRALADSSGGGDGGETAASSGGGEGGQTAASSGGGGGGEAAASSGGGDAGKAGAAAMVGNWKSSGSSSPQVFGEDGTCSGFYYNNGVPLDIGGPMTCTMSSTPDAEGRYALVVTQSPNQAKYKVAFDTADHATVYSSTGQKIYEIDRF